jgi:hypothetical protein
MLALLSTMLASSALAQRIPASSSDSGRRAVVAIDQQQINNNVNNAVNIANYANSVANNAQNSANNAQWTADRARDAANAAAGSGGEIVTQFNVPGNNGGSIIGLCIKGWDPNSLANLGRWPCPGGSGPFVVREQGSGGGGPGGGGGGT